MLKFALLQYYFDGEEHPIQVPSHGNSKQKQSAFKRVQKSTLKQLKENVASVGGSKAARLVNEGKGGVIGARSAGELVRNRRQAYNAKAAAGRSRASSAPSHSSVDP